ncbi:MAG TPA: dienelactone hydrolase family protein [Candidatus Hydrogenedentes bacterium]|nr:dienelactone hydrolase family protein [Candidatus Hydrogenedentota bacterium]
MLDLGKLKNLSAWPQMRGDIESALLAVLGDLPKERVEPQAKTVDETEHAGYVRKRVNYFVDGWERVSAWLFVPDGKEEAPAIVCCHRETPAGKDEAAGIEGDMRLAFAQHYAELGYVTLAPDCLTAGERRVSSAKPFDTKQYYKSNTKLSFAGRMLVDHMYALDLLEEQKRVDAARIGVIGHGLGAFNALLLAAFDDRVRACVASCGFTRFATDKDPQRWARAEGMCLLPELRKRLDSGDFAFDWEHILALAAPSPTLIITSTSDTPFANPKSCEKAVTLAGRVYKLLGARTAIDHQEHQQGFNNFTRETLEIADEWFERWL